jgi:hypothetical protein
MREANKTRTVFDGQQLLYRFQNDYGASVVKHTFSYGGASGLWELAVIKFTGPDITDFKICYDTEITNDVVGFLGEQDVDTMLDRIEALPPAV